MVTFKFRKLLLVISLEIIGFCLAGSLTMAQDDSSFNIDANLVNQYNYFFYRNDLPATGRWKLLFTLIPPCC